MLRKVMIGALAGLAMTLSTAAFAQAQFGTAAEAKAMLEKAVAAVKADKEKALAMFNKGEGGFKDRDFQPFCFNVSDGKLVVATVPSLLGTDVRALTDKAGKVFGQEVYKAAIEGKITEVSYMFPRPGTDPTLFEKGELCYEGWRFGMRRGLFQVALERDDRLWAALSIDAARCIKGSQRHRRLLPRMRVPKGHGAGRCESSDLPVLQVTNIGVNRLLPMHVICCTHESASHLNRRPRSWFCLPSAR